MQTYCLHRIDTDHSPLIELVQAETPAQALGGLHIEIRAQQVGTIMELRTAGQRPITISNDIASIYQYPEGTADAVVIWSRPSMLQ